ncbi:MAG: radical SAM protein [Candidatus Abyssobacteria bacterium SURF_5]|uniref:Radical SAM protein n=1 Tax=Abyssobacteria bacterium (strain SURF_5) TaxID=2093360 RepID=A0A3A4NZI9_ABYX5|nr:MAG: radical SAM protein [Candidatus Abyssubacteria bacterium SURF_5]
MHVFLAYIRDDNFYHLLPEKIRRRTPDNGRVKVMAFPPLGIQTLAPVLRRHGHRVQMFDSCHPQMKAADIAQAARKNRPDLIALSSLSTTTYPAVKATANRLKIEAPDIPIILGGVFPSMNPVHILRDCPDIDCIGVGEGEELLPEYLDHLADPGAVAGLVWRKNGDIIQNDRRPLIQDLDRFPYPDRSSLPIDYVESLPMDVPAVLSLDRFCTMQTSRGCPYNCSYCNISVLFGGKWRHRSAEHVLGEMQELSDQGYRSIYFTDDHFLLNRKRINAICTGIINRNLKFHWGCEGRVDSVAIDQFPIMKKAGCFALSFGIESGTQKVLDLLNKKQSLDEIEHAVKQAKRSGISRIHGFFLIGSPNETEPDVMASFRFAAKLQIDTFNFNRLCVYRGTPLWKEYVGRGIIDDDADWSKWFKCSDIDPTVLPSEALNSMRMKGYLYLFVRRIFCRPIQTMKLVRAFSRNMEWSDIFRLLASPFKKRTMFHKPDLPEKMIALGIDQPIREHLN